ncbi:MAG: hypothetical protein ACC628_13010, partial [Pirellulaceae bacterium]
LIVGQREMESDSVAVLDRLEGDLGATKTDAAIAKFKDEISARTVRKTYQGDAGLGEQGSVNEY